MDLAKWILLDREDGEGNADYYSPQNSAVNTSAFQILTKFDSSHPGLSYSSAEAQWRSFSYLYGTLEVRAKFAGGKGSWPAVWLLGHNCQTSNVTTPANVGDCNWPAPGSDEIDIAEVLYSNSTQINQQLHSNGHDNGCAPFTTDSSANFHSYQLVWQPGSLIWKIDGTTTCTVAASYVPNTAMFLILNNAVGPGGGPIDSSTFPQTMLVDYVRLTK